MTTEKAEERGSVPASGQPFWGQFLLGPSIPEAYKNWRAVKVDETAVVAAHPTLSITQVGEGERSLTLLGCMLDPLDPRADDAGILRGLLRKFTVPAELIRATNRLGGRWILICRDENQAFLFNDAMALRQVFYTDPARTQQLWSFSQPWFAEQCAGLDHEVSAQQFMNSFDFRADKEYKWPLAASPYQDVKRLLPNHYLDLRSGAIHRFWPDRAIGRQSLDQGIEALTTLARGLLMAAAMRFDLAVSVTAGLDSRLVWAACREIRDRVNFVTLRKAKDADDHADVTVSARLAQRLGVAHEVISVPETASPEFSRMFKQSVYLAHDHYAADAEAILNRFSRTKVAVTGSGGELGRCYYGVRIPGYRKVTPEYLGRVAAGSSVFEIRRYSEWLKQIGDPFDVHVLDLFYWENRSAWLSMTQLEFDIAWRDIITPYNCRELIRSILAVDERHREPLDYHMYVQSVKKLWAELLSEPINPHQHRLSTWLSTRLKMGIKHAVLAAKQGRNPGWHN